jgi:hypothetical protein
LSRTQQARFALRLWHRAETQCNHYIG